MLLFDGAAGVLLLALWLFCLVDVIITNEYACRNLPKLLWLLIVLVLPDIGSLLWLILGRPQGVRVARLADAQGSAASRGFDPRAAGAAHVANPDDDEEFMAQVRLRAEQQRQRARDQRRDQTPPSDAGDNPAQPDAG